MHNSRRMVLTGLSLMAIGSLFAGVAGAQSAGVTAGTWGGTASADALTISIAGQTLTTSAATAELRPGLATASATQVLTPIFTNTNSVELSSSGSAEDLPESCTGSQLTAIPLIGRFDITCGGASATLSADGGSARGLGSSLVIEASLSGMLETIQLQQPVQGGANQLFEALNPLVEGLTGTPLADLVGGTVQTLQDVVDDVLTLRAIARVVVSPALAQVDADASKVVARSQAQGIRIELLPVDATGATNGLLPDDLDAGEPLVTVTVGAAEVTKTVPKAGGEGETTAAASLVSIEFGSIPLLERLGLPTGPITIDAGQSLCIPGLEGTPLETCITVADAGVDAVGNPFADGTSVQLFKGVNGGIDLATGRAATAPAAAPPAAAPPAADGQTAAPAAAPGGQLPRTGGPAVLPLLGGGLLGLAALTRRFVAGRR